MSKMYDDILIYTYQIPGDYFYYDPSIIYEDQKHILYYIFSYQNIIFKDLIYNIFKIILLFHLPYIGNTITLLRLIRIHCSVYFYVILKKTSTCIHKIGFIKRLGN